MFSPAQILKHRAHVTTITRHHARNIRTSAKGMWASAHHAQLAGEVRPKQTEMPKLQGVPEIVVTGRANAGKSSLLNAVLGVNGLIETSGKAVSTGFSFLADTQAFICITKGSDKVIAILPSRQPAWLLFNDYLENRKELKRVYILINGVHGVKESDQQMLQDLDARCQSSQGQKFTLQAVITKLDLLTSEDQKQAATRLQQTTQDIFKFAPTCLPPILTSTARHPPIGIDTLRQSIAEACGIGRVKSTVVRDR
ncbi:hypothetical protein EIP91_008973 [Steccherinum ochraceum]|uniref:G domain-containing protein n=1 Tax=Steccherinum ochraceum TaxID=92696 RepID=A0A4R0RS07_9APHY|nr:hypothetical protein EIP91_008973 [Steccherinum ochraceum]